MEQRREFLQSLRASNKVKVRKVLDKGYPSQVLQDADQARKDGTFCDVTLLIGPGKFEIKAHRMMLASASVFFRTMFTSDFKELTQKEVELPEIDAGTMKEIMNFIYTGNIALKNGNIEHITHAANFLEMSKLLGECTKYLTEIIDYDNCIELLEFADHLGNDKLKSNAKKYFIENHSQISAKNLYIMDISITLLLEILGDDSAAIHSDPSENEERLLQFGLNRLQFESDDVFRQYLPELLKMIHLPKASHGFLNSLARKLENFEEANVLIKEARDKKLMMEPTFTATSALPKIDSKQRWVMNRFQHSGKCSVTCYNVKNDPQLDKIIGRSGEPVFIEGIPFCLLGRVVTSTDGGPPVKYFAAFVYCLGSLKGKSITCKYKSEVVSPKKPALKAYWTPETTITFSESHANWGRHKLIKLSELLADYYDIRKNSCTIIAHIRDIKAETCNN